MLVHAQDHISSAILIADQAEEFIHIYEVLASILNEKGGIFMRIMLACQAGMSTSLVVSKMLEAAQEQGKDYKIWAVDQELIQNELGNFDVLLLGPFRIWN